MAHYTAHSSGHLQRRHSQQDIGARSCLQAQKIQLQNESTGVEYQSIQRECIGYDASILNNEMVTCYCRWDD